MEIKDPRGSELCPWLGSDLGASFKDRFYEKTCKP